jgi:hypothetical protein
VTGFKFRLLRYHPKPPLAQAATLVGGRQLSATPEAASDGQVQCTGTCRCICRCRGAACGSEPCFWSHLAGRPCAGKSNHKKPRTQRMLASVWPASESAWAAPLSERPTGHWLLDELNSARRGRWQLSTQQYQVLTAT